MNKSSLRFYWFHPHVGRFEIVKLFCYLQAIVYFINSVASPVFGFVKYHIIRFFLLPIALCIFSLNAYAQTASTCNVSYGDESLTGQTCNPVTFMQELGFGGTITCTTLSSSGTSGTVGYSASYCCGDSLGDSCPGDVAAIGMTVTSAASSGSVCPSGSELAGQSIASTANNACNPGCANQAATVYANQPSTSGVNGQVLIFAGCEGYEYGCNGKTCNVCIDGNGVPDVTATSVIYTDTEFTPPPISCQNFTGTGDPSTQATPQTCPPGSQLAGQQIAATASCNPSTAKQTCPAGSQLAGQSISASASCNPTTSPATPAPGIPSPVNPQPGDPTNPNGSAGGGEAGVPNVTPPASPGGGGGTVESPGTAISYGAFPSLPTTFYTRRYTSIADVYVTDILAIEQTPLFSLLGQFAMPSGVGTVPSFTFDFSSFCGFNFGVHVWQVDSNILSVVILFLQLVTLYTCFSIIFL